MTRPMHAPSDLSPIDRLDALPELEQRVVRLARVWRLGPAAQAEAHRDLVARHGLDVARGIQQRLDEILCLLVFHGRRDMAFAPHGSEGVLGDECVLARLVSRAAEGEREDAALIATLLVRVDLAFGLAATAEALGLLLQRAPSRWRTLRAMRPN